MSSSLTIVELFVDFNESSCATTYYDFVNMFTILKKTLNKRMSNILSEEFVLNNKTKYKILRLGNYLYDFTNIFKH